jgi:hypothetical protein
VRLPRTAGAIIATMQSGATLYQEGDRVWYLAGVNLPRTLVDADVCEWLEAHEYIREDGDDESPGYIHGWRRWYILPREVRNAR